MSCDVCECPKREIDYYGVLEIKKNSDDLEIKRAFRRLAIRYNPEGLYKSESYEVIFSLVAEAYDVLSNPLRRTVYDQYGEEGLKSGVQGPEDYVQPYVYHGEAMRTYREFFGTESPYADLLDILWKPSDLDDCPEARGLKRKEEPLFHPLPLSLAEVFHGGCKKMKIERLVFKTEERIDTVLREKILNVPIKPGLPTGTKIVFPEEGDQGPSKIPVPSFYRTFENNENILLSPADIVFVTEDRPHETFKRELANLSMMVKILLRDALVGTVVTVKTIDEKILRVPITSIITPEYEKLVPNEGLPFPENSLQRGDLVIRFDIEFPLYMPIISKNYVKKAFMIHDGAKDDVPRGGVHFGADQVRILLFRECEWRGRKLLFDSVSARKAGNATNDAQSQSNGKQTNGACTRNCAGLVAEHERVACDDVSLLSEMVFGTVAMTYRGTLFKVHALNAPKCIMCTKVFPAPDHSVHRLSERPTDDALGHSTTVDSNSSGGSARNTMSHLSSGTFSANCLRPEVRKNSTCSSTSSGWDIDVPLGSSQSLESSSSSGFGSLTSLRRRWLRAVSTVLSHAELEEKFGIQAYCENTAERRDSSINRRHKTRLGLAVLIQLTPGCERQMEGRLLEHAGQLEAMLNRLCHACIEACRNHGKSNGECKGLTSRMHSASNRCIASLLRLLSNIEDNRMSSLWHEVIMNSTTTHVHRTNTLHRNLQQICQLINGVDTKSTNFFLSTVLTAVLTHHLGWVQTVMSPQHKRLMENLGKRYPCNPLWAQLGDLYGALGNPSKLVHTVITGDSEKAELINEVLTFLSYFIRSAVVKKRREYRCPSQLDVKKAIAALDHAKRKNDLEKSFKAEVSRDRRDEGTRARMCDEESRSAPENRRELPTRTNSTESVRLSDEMKSGPMDSGLQRLKRATSAHKNLDLLTVSSAETRSKHLVKVESLDDDDPIGVDVSLLAPRVTEKNLTAGTVKIIIDEAAPSPANDFSGTKKRLPRVPPGYNLRDKVDLEDMEDERLGVEAKLASLQARRNDSGFHSQKFYPEYCPIETQAFYARLDLPKDEQQSQVFFTLGDEAKRVHETTASHRQPVDSDCQCSFAFTRVPSTSAELPEGVLRKIIQRNFPESSKSIERPPLASMRNEKLAASCPKCNGAALTAPQSLEGSKLLLETPTNATEVLRTCGNSVGDRATRLVRSNSLEALMEANGVVELPMPRSKNSSTSAREFSEVTGFTKTLLHRRVASNVDETLDPSSIYDAGYTSGLVIQGLTKRKRKKSKNSHRHREVENEAQGVGTEWLSQLREEVNINAKFPVIDQPVSEALCILADIDNWQVGILSNSSTVQSPLVPVGMSRLVATMLESFAYLWTEYRSPSHCIGIFEGKLREMWLRSEALAEMLMAVDVCDVTIASLTKALDLDAADIPLLLAVATTHSPQIAQRFGLSIA